jgi:hypothetical protein
MMTVWYLVQNHACLLAPQVGKVSRQESAAEGRLSLTHLVEKYSGVYLGHSIYQSSVEADEREQV